MYHVHTPFGSVIKEYTFHKAVMELSRTIYISQRDCERLSAEKRSGAKVFRVNYGFATGEIHEIS